MANRLMTKIKFEVLDPLWNGSPKSKFETETKKIEGTKSQVVVLHSSQLIHYIATAQATLTT